MNNVYQNLRLGYETKDDRTFIETMRRVVSSNRPTTSSVPVAVVSGLNTAQIFPSKKNMMDTYPLTRGQRDELTNSGEVQVGVRKIFSLI